MVLVRLVQLSRVDQGSELRSDLDVPRHVRREDQLDDDAVELLERVLWREWRLSTFGIQEKSRAIRLNWLHPGEEIETRIEQDLHRL